MDVGRSQQQRPSIVTLVFLLVYVAIPVAVSAWVWTTDSLYMTDGMPTARDHFSPAALGVTTIVLVLVAWIAAGALHVTTLAIVRTVRTLARLGRSR